MYPAVQNLPSRISPKARAMTDLINSPPHYTPDDPTYETINVIEAWGLGYHLGNAVKYISRAGKKDSKAQDLRKAVWYLNREIER